MNFATKTNVTIPRTLFQSLVNMSAEWDAVQERLENFLLSSDQKFIKKMTRARQQHLLGKAKPLSVLKRELVF